jgi:hypothetical protein
MEEVSSSLGWQSAWCVCVCVCVCVCAQLLSPTLKMVLLLWDSGVRKEERGDQVLLSPDSILLTSVGPSLPF